MMEQKDIYLQLKSICEEHHAHSDQLMSISAWVHSEFEPKRKDTPTAPKKSELLREEATEEDDDFKAMGVLNKALRAEREEKFEENWLEELERHTEVIKRDNGSYTFDSRYGIVDFYPKANKLLIRDGNTWEKPGLKFIIEEILG